MSDPDLALVLAAVGTAIKNIVFRVRTASLSKITGLYTGKDGEAGVNQGGEKQKKLDVVAVRRCVPWEST